MFRHELTPFLRRVLDAVDLLPEGMLVDSSFEPDAKSVGMIALELNADFRDVREALLGLEARSCFVQESLEVPGIEPIRSWHVHPQCRKPGAQPTPRNQSIPSKTSSSDS